VIGMAEIKFADLIEVLQSQQAKIDAGTEAQFKLDALRDDVRDLVTHLTAMATSYTSSYERYSANNETDMAEWSIGKAQAYRVSASKLEDLIR